MNQSVTCSDFVTYILVRWEGTIQEAALGMCLKVYLALWIDSPR